MQVDITNPFETNYLIREKFAQKSTIDHHIRRIIFKLFPAPVLLITLRELGRAKMHSHELLRIQRQKLAYSAKNS